MKTQHSTPKPGLRHRDLSSFAAALALAAIFLLANSAFASTIIRPFGVRYTANDTGDITIIGNALLTCAPTLPPSAACANAQAGISSPLNNDSFDMGYLDTDNDPATFNSSQATLSLPANASVLFAGLYWDGDVTPGVSGLPAPDVALSDTVRLSTPASGGYITVTASAIDSSTTNGIDYQGFADVTALVQAGGSGDYVVANLQAGTGSGGSGQAAGGRQAGWALVVAYHDPSQPQRSITIFDGFAIVDSAAPSSVVIPVSGFLTPLSGPVVTRIGVVAYEGDLGATGDSLILNSTMLSDTLNPGSNFFNASNTFEGAPVTSANPNYPNRMSIDADIVNAFGILPNGATSANITLTTSGDVYFPGVVTFVTDIYAPQIAIAKSYTDLNGGKTYEGDILEYTLVITNAGLDATADTILTDTIPANTSYVAGSLAILTGPNSGALTDASGDDQAEFDAGGKRVRFRLGTGANAASGGTLIAGDSTALRFRVRVGTNLSPDTIIRNQAGLTYRSATAGTAFSGESNSVETPVVAYNRYYIPFLLAMQSSGPTYLYYIPILPQFRW